MVIPNVGMYNGNGSVSYDKDWNIVYRSNGKIISVDALREHGQVSRNTELTIPTGGDDCGSGIVYHSHSSSDYCGSAGDINQCAPQLSMTSTSQSGLTVCRLPLKNWNPETVWLTNLIKSTDTCNGKNV